MPAKFNILVAVTIPLVPVIPLLACGGDTKTVDAHINVIDSPGSGSGSGGCHIAASLGTPTFTAQGGQYKGSSATQPFNELLMDGQMSNMQDIRVIIFGGCGTTGANCGGSANATPDWPTTFGAKSGVNLMTAPDAVVIALADLSGQSYQTIYAANSGTLNVTAAGNASGTAYAANGTNVVLQHIDIGSNGSITNDPDNCMSTITSFSLSGSAQFDGKTVIIDAPTRDEAIKQYLAHRYQ